MADPTGSAESPPPEKDDEGGSQANLRRPYPREVVLGYGFWTGVPIFGWEYDE